jgi:hypothetical protein
MFSTLMNGTVFSAGGWIMVIPLKVDWAVRA